MTDDFRIAVKYNDVGFDAVNVSVNVQSSMTKRRITDLVSGKVGHEVRKKQYSILRHERQQQENCAYEVLLEMLLNTT